MNDNQKTVVAAAVLAAAVGVYMEISYQEKLRSEARRRAFQPSASASASASSSAPTAPGVPRR